ncbi:MAG: hypothetical protein B7X10_01430 [Burkholderiales bacterium 21-58-4]|nr:MAG: hypothetical protein B7X10_01430 [Burkholderiales bacterium 21-58-4]
MEKIGFIARRTGTHVKSLMAFQQAGASLGSSAEGATESLEGLSAFMRNTPGSSGFLKELGVQTKDAHGHALDTVKIMEQLGQSFKKMPTYIAHQYASVLGISDHMMLALRSGKVPDLEKKFKKPLEGAKLDKVSIVANQAMIAGRVLGMKKEATEAKVALPVLSAFAKADEATKGLSTDLLGLAKFLGEASVGVMIFKAATGLLVGKEVVSGAETASVGIGGKVGRVFGGATRALGIGGAAFGGWEAGKWIDKNVPGLHDAIVSTLQTLHVIPRLDVVHAYPASGPYATTSPRSGANTTVNQTISIQVNGAKDTHETARQIKQELRMAAHNNQMAAH